jgi:hypothetical protein
MPIIPIARRAIKVVVARIIFINDNRFSLSYNSWVYILSIE